MCDAFIQEKKHFDLLIIPGATHYRGPEYDAVTPYFREHLFNKK
jgi:hypothetical protein